LPEQRISGALHELYKKSMIDRTPTPAPTGAYGRAYVYRFWTVSDTYIRKPMNVPRPRKPKELKAEVEDFKNKTTELLDSWTAKQARETKDILFAPSAPAQSDPVEIVKNMTVYQARDLYTHLKEVFGH
jgi:predicted transcriptional regulator